MRLSELLKADVVDGAGRRIGTVRDVRLTGGPPDEPMTVAGLIVGDGPLAAFSHSSGFVAGRATGPWLLRAVARPAARRARFVAARDVTEWGSETVTIRRDAKLLTVEEALAR